MREIRMLRLTRGARVRLASTLPPPRELFLDPAFARGVLDKGDEVEHGFTDFPECFEDRYAEKMQRNQRQ